MIQTELKPVTIQKFNGVNIYTRHCICTPHVKCSVKQHFTDFFSICCSKTCYLLKVAVKLQAHLDCTGIVWICIKGCNNANFWGDLLTAEILLYCSGLVRAVCKILMLTLIYQMVTKLFNLVVLKIETGGRENGCSTHPLPHMFDLRSYNATLRVLVSHPVLSASVDYTTADTLQHIAKS